MYQAKAISSAIRIEPSPSAVRRDDHLNHAVREGYVSLYKNEVRLFRQLFWINLHLLCNGKTMDYPEIICLLSEYSALFDTLCEVIEAREGWHERGLVPGEFACLTGILERRRSRMAKQQELVSPLLDSILAEYPQTPPRIQLNAHGKFSVV